MELYKIAKLIRSKNAGPFMLTIDILFSCREDYDFVLKSGVLTKENVARIYKVPLSKMDYYESPKALALKFSFPRPVPVGDFGEEDLFGGQYHAPLVMLDILGS